MIGTRSCDGVRPSMISRLSDMTLAIGRSIYLFKRSDLTN